MVRSIPHARSSSELLLAASGLPGNSELTSMMIIDVANDLNYHWYLLNEVEPEGVR